jgi:predicted acylesterase/phospholipase RssA
VGLAFSGGGVRSASFNLGLLQALYRFGLLKHIDYLATVSGGGYIGSYLASLTQGPDVQLSKDDPEMRGQLVAAPAQPQRIVHFVRNGKYLSRPESFTNRYLIGLVLNNLAMFSGLAFVCLAIAFLWRLLDTNLLGGFLYLYLPPTRTWTELWRPFLPAVLFFSLWVLAWSWAFARSLWKRERPKTRLTGRLLLIAVAALLIGVAVVLATPVISIPQVGTDDGKNEGVLEVSGGQHVIATSIIGIIITALTPFLRPERLLQSGIHPKSIWERRVFRIATTALLAGVPFSLIWWFAHHDFAGLDMEIRDRQILMGDINYRKWIAFWERTQGEAENDPATPGGFIRRAIGANPKVKETLADQKCREDLGKVPVPIWADDRDRKQQIIDAINAWVIGADFDASTGRKIRDEPYESDFAHHVVCNYWCKEGVGEQRPTERRAFLEAKIRHHGEWPRIQTLLDRLEHYQLTREEKKELNRLMLEVCYPEEILPRMRVYRHNVIAQDQKCRLWWLLGLGGVFLVSACVSLNATSLHSFYRDRLAKTFIEPIENQDRTIRLSNLDTTARGAPYFLFSATLNRKARDRDPSMLSRKPSAKGPTDPPESTRPAAPDGSRLGHERPGETATETFLLSRHYCGSASLGYCLTSVYQGGRLELDDAMAISGAAFSPVQTSSPLIGFLMTIFNMRLGQWLPDPALDPRQPRNPVLGSPTVHALFWEWLREQFWPSERRPAWYFITDGGHHENLGLWPLLERRCRLIIVSDASEDSEAGFSDLLRVVRRARFEKGIRVTGLTPQKHSWKVEEEDELVSLLRLLRPACSGAESKVAEKDRPEKSEVSAPRKSSRHFFFARIDYPDDGAGPKGGPREGYLIYLKPTLTGDESAELRGYAALNADFPHNPTLDQLYDEDRFESYRQLGEHIGDRLCAELMGRDGTEGKMWEWSLNSDNLLDSFFRDDTPQEEALDTLRDRDRRDRREQSKPEGRPSEDAGVLPNKPR